MKRAFVKSFSPIRSAFLHHGEKISTGVAKRSYINNGNFTTSSYNICKCGLPSSYMFSRTISSDAAEVNYKGSKIIIQKLNLVILLLLKVENDNVVFITEVKRSGPLVEYERRIKAGDLEDGDKSQVI